VLSISLIYSFLIVLYSWTIEDNIFNRLVNDEATHITEQFKRSGEVLPPKADYMRLVENFTDLPIEIQKEYPSNPSKVEYQTRSGKTLHMTTIKLGGQHLFLLADVEQFEVSKDNMPNLLVWLLVIACLISAIALVVSLQTAKKITGPLKALASDVNKKNAGNIESDAFPENEIGLLALNTKNAFNQLNTALERERVFTKDISHEIRTPVAIIQNVLSASKKEKTITESNFDTVTEAVANINQITSILLALARSESSQTETVNLTAELEFLIINQFDFLLAEAGKHLELTLNFEGDVKVTCNQNLVSILMLNLLSNMVRHASSDYAEITLNERQLIFKNQTQQNTINSPFVSGVKGEQSEGLGHGLNLIQRICEQSNWQLSIEQPPGYFIAQINFANTR
jgi:signal transduction histidine kinase